MALRINNMVSHPSIVSRLDLLHWVNKLLDSNFQKLQNFRTGIEYCTLMGILYPKLKMTKRIKYQATTALGYLQNYKLLQAALCKENIDKQLPIELLLKGSFKEHFNLLAWFKKLFETVGCAATLTVRSNHGPMLAQKAVSCSTVVDRQRPNKPMELKTQCNDLSNQLVEVRFQLQEAKGQCKYLVQKLREIERICSKDKNALLSIKRISAIVKDPIISCMAKDYLDSVDDAFSCETLHA